MTWKIRHEGFAALDQTWRPSASREGLQDGLWEPTDEVMGPQDKTGLRSKNQPAVGGGRDGPRAAVASAQEDETRLDMNPLIDVALVLLIFFILTTSYAALQRMLGNAADEGRRPEKVTPSFARAGQEADGLGQSVEGKRQISLPRRGTNLSKKRTCALS